MVASFLQDFKTLTQKELSVIPRKENQQALIDLGLTFRDRVEILMALEVEDYSSGPDADRDRAGFVWVFGKVVLDVEVYIKLKIVEYIPCGTDRTQRKAICLSFHRAKASLNYPFK